MAEELLQVTQTVNIQDVIIRVLRRSRTKTQDQQGGGGQVKKLKLY